MNDAPSREMAIAMALGKCADAVDLSAPGRWAFTLSNGTDLAARARVDDGWLLLTAALGDGSVSPARSWELLRWNAVLDGGARFAVRAGRPGLHACAELPLDDEVDLPRRVLEACGGLKAANERRATVRLTRAHRPRPMSCSTTPRMRWITTSTSSSPAQWRRTMALLVPFTTACTT